MSADSQLYEDSFVIGAMNHAKYDRVGRVTAVSTDGQTNITLDVNTDLYPMAQQETFQLLLASTLNLDGTKDPDGKGWRELSNGEATLADMWDYVCFGKVYRFEEGADAESIKVFVSFGGLLLYIEGPYKKLTPLRVDHVYLLIKK